MLIESSDITYSYPGEPNPVFSQLCFSIRGPGFISLFGLSGTGKSTLARIISKEIIPDKGSLSIPSGLTILYSHNAERLPGWCTVGEHIQRVTAKGSDTLFRELIRELAVDAIMGSRFRELSMGQKNRVNLLRYLLQDFDVLIGDEILANVDEPTRNHILGTIKRYFPAKTFLYISHNALEVARFSKQILVLPVNTGSGHRSMRSLPGLDLAMEHNHPQGLQQRVMQILQAATSHEPVEAPANHISTGTGVSEAV